MRASSSRNTGKIASYAADRSTCRCSSTKTVRSVSCRGRKTTRDKRCGRMEPLATDRRTSEHVADPQKIDPFAVLREAHTPIQRSDRRPVPEVEAAVHDPVGERIVVMVSRVAEF